MNFFRTLRMEIKKIADFFVQEQATHTSQVVTIEQQFLDLKVGMSLIRLRIRLLGMVLCSHASVYVYNDVSVEPTTRGHN